MLSVSVSEGKFKLAPQDIIYLEASRNYTRIHLHNRPCILSAKTLKEYENKLSAACFCRVRSSHLVNSDYVTALNDKDEMILGQETRIKIAKRKRTAVLRWLREKERNTNSPL